MYKITWALQWQPQSIIGWRDTQIGPPIHASILPCHRYPLENIPSIMDRIFLKYSIKFTLTCSLFTFTHTRS